MTALEGQTAIQQWPGGYSSRMTSLADIVLGSRFLVFDGPDGSGKSTQFRRFINWARNEGAKVAPTELREPGGTPIGERIREVLLDVAHEEMTVTCEMLLYMASRAQIVEEVVQPAIGARRSGDLGSLHQQYACLSGIRWRIVP